MNFDAVNFTEHPYFAIFADKKSQQMFIGVISDTHGVFSEEFRQFLEPVDVIWHAGDFGGGQDFVREIASFKPLIGVAGNCDSRDLLFQYPMYQNFDYEGMNILMTHIGGYPGHYDYRAWALIDKFRPDIFVCGHSHILKVMKDPTFGHMVINPGAAGLQGIQIVRTALRFHIDNGKIHDMEVFNLNR